MKKKLKFKRVQPGQSIHQQYTKPEILESTLLEVDGARVMTHIVRSEEGTYYRISLPDLAPVETGYPVPKAIPPE